MQAKGGIVEARGFGVLVYVSIEQVLDGVPGDWQVFGECLASVG